MSRRKKPVISEDVRHWDCVNYDSCLDKYWDMGLGIQQQYQEVNFCKDCDRYQKESEHYRRNWGFNYHANCLALLHAAFSGMNYNRGRNTDTEKESEIEYSENEFELLPN